jgi:hypothetical protein
LPSLADLLKGHGQPGDQGETSTGARLTSYLDIGAKASTSWEAFSSEAQNLIPDGYQGVKSAVTFTRFFLRNQLQSAYLHRQGFTSEASRLANCGRTVWMHFGGGYVPYEPCGQRFLCLFCAKRDEWRKRRKYVAKIAKLIQQGGYVPVHLVLTVKDGPGLVERLECLLAALRGGLEAARKARGGCRNVTAFSAMAGGLYSVEFKRGKNSGQWHVHVHALVLLERGTWVDAAALRAEWERRTEGSKNVHLKRLERVESLERSVCEVLKYTVKIATLPGQDCVDVWQAVRGRRLMATWGCLRGLPEAVQAEIDSEDAAAGTREELGGVLKWDQGSGQFRVAEWVIPAEWAHLVKGAGDADRGGSAPDRARSESIRAAYAARFTKDKGGKP